MGTPHYMSPEQVEGRTRDISEASDIYALGVILYEILAGHPPFRADAPVRVYQKILAEDAERITRPVNPDLEMICRKAMEKEPKRRYDRALDFADDLSRFRRGEPIRARPPSLFYRFRKTLARRRSSVIAAATIVSVLSATAVYLHTRQERDRTERDAEARRQNEERGRERRIREEEERQRLVKDERARRLREEMDPVEIRIRDTRRLFYVPDVDMRSEIEKLEAALTRLERLTIEEAYASVPELWGLLGIGRYFTGEADLAQQALEKAEKLGSTDGWVFYYLGRIHLENGLSYRLTESYDIQRVRDFTEVGKKYIKRSTATEPIDLQIAEGYLALAEDEGAEISAKLRKICEEGLQRFGTMPGTEEFRLLLAWGYEGKLEDQLAEYTKAIERRPHFPWALFLRATVRYRRNDLPGTQKDYDAALRLYPKWWLPYLNRGAVRAQLKDLDGAFADFSAVTRLNPSYYAGWFNRGRVYFFRKEYDSALADFDQAIKLRPKYAMAHMNKGNVLYDLKRYDDAFEAFQHAIDLDGTSPLARANRGLIYARWGKWKEAAADFETALRLAPEDWEHRTFVENNYRASLQRARAQDP
jgi:tetratricopeptide (TPR) repeat protein